MLFDDYFYGYGVAFTPVGTPEDVPGPDAGYGDASGFAGIATVVADDWLLATDPHQLDFSVYTLPPPVLQPGADADSGLAGIAGAVTAADHDRMLVINPYAPDPNYYAPPPAIPYVKKVSTISWYYVDTGPLATPPKPT